MIAHSLNRLYEGKLFGSGWPLHPQRDYPHFETDIYDTVVYDTTHVSMEWQWFRFEFYNFNNEDNINRDGIKYFQEVKEYRNCFIIFNEASILLKNELILLFIFWLLSLYLTPHLSQYWLYLPFVLWLHIENIPPRLLFFLLFHVWKLIVKCYNFQILEVLLWLIVEPTSKFIFLFPLYTPFKMLKCSLFQLVNRTVHVLGSGLFLRYNFSAHDIVMIAEPCDFIFNNFRPSIFCTTVGYIDELVLIKWINWYVFFLSYFQSSLLQPGQFVTFVGLGFENFFVRLNLYRKENLAKKYSFCWLSKSALKACHRGAWVWEVWRWYWGK